MCEGGEKNKGHGSIVRGRGICITCEHQDRVMKKGGTERVFHLRKNQY